MIRDGGQWTGGKSPFTYISMPAVLEFDEKPETGKPFGQRQTAQKAM
jgi:hypothetical protein